MKIREPFNNLVRKLNTVHVGNVGLGAAFASTATIIFAPGAQGLVDAHVRGYGHYALTQLVSMALTGARATLAPSIFAAWAGMPKPVAAALSGPGSPQSAPPGGNVVAFPTKRDSNAA